MKEGSVIEKCTIFLGVLACVFMSLSFTAIASEGTLVVAVSTDLVGLDPVVQHTTTELMMNRHIYDSLVALGRRHCLSKVKLCCEKCSSEYRRC